MLTGRTLGDFTVKEKIGEGGYGVVYRAEQRLLGREAVIKVLHARHGAAEALVARFNREAQLASRLDHPFAAHIYAFGAEPDGLLWIAMELVRGTPLSKLLGARRMTLTRFVPLLDRLCEVVHTAHEQGIVHRDLKPDNVMVLSRAGRLLPKLLDLGIAKLVAERATGGDTPVPDDIDATADTMLTQRGVHMGSPFYMAPEQWSDAAEVDARADLYALGVLTYEALCGRVPFPGTTVGEIARGHLRGEMPALPPELPAALEPVLRRALAKKREDRFDSALAFASAVRGAAGMRMAADALPRLDDALRDEIAWMPQPIAEAVGAVEAARNPHQARDAVWEVVHVCARYLGLLALACASRTGTGGAAALLRDLPRRDLADDEWLALVRALTQSFAGAREAYPIPELVDLAAPFAPLFELRAGELATTSEETLRDRLARTLPLLAPLLRSLSFLTDYQLVVARGGAGDLWMGPRRSKRPQIAVGEGLRDGEAAIVDLDGRPVVHLAPLVQCATPAPGAAEELFLFAGPARARGRGARLVAEPHGFERVDDTVWDWFRDDRELPAEETPYRGLHAFGAGDAALFFGRERQTEAFLNQLLVQPLLAVVGPSGAGKSSFVQAGVLPALPEGWRAVTIRPGATPDLPADLEDTVLVIDQFEELFTLCLDPERRVRFADSLVRAAGERTRVVLTLRDDFLVRAGELAPLRDRLAQGLTLLSTPAPDDLLRIVTEPARRAGYDFDDPDLPARMVRAVAGQPGALALLSFTASRLWELRDRHFHRLTRKSYDAIGGVEGALAGHAEETLLACTAEEQKLVREAFRHLVTAEGTRAVLTRAELAEILGRGARADAVIERLVAARLLVATENADGAETIEVIHEALLSAWPRLVDWRRDDADGARLRDQLRAAARQWQDRGRPRGLLWRDDALDDYRRWRARWPGALPDLDESFAAASLRDARRGRTIRRSLAATALAVLIAGTVSLALLYRSSQRNAGRATRNAGELHQRLVESYVEQGRRYLLAGDHQKALPYLATAYAEGDTSTELRFLLARAMRWAGAEIASHRHGAPAADAAFRSGGREVLSVDRAGGAAVWEAATGRTVAELAAATEGGAAFPDVSDDGAFAVIPWRDRVLVWDGTTTRELRVAAVERVAIDATGSFVALASRDRIAVWDLRTRAEVWSQPLAVPATRILLGTAGALVRDENARVTLVGGGEPVDLGSAEDNRGLAAGADGVLAIAGGHKVQVRNPDGTPRWSADVPIAVTSAAFSGDGARLAIAAGDGRVRLYEASTGRVLAELDGPSDNPRLGLDADGSRLAEIGDSKLLTVWDVATGRPVLRLPGVEQSWTLSVDPTGDRVLLTALDGGARALSTADPDVSLSITAPDELLISDATGDGRQLMTGTPTKIQVWDAATGALLHATTPSMTGNSHLSADGRLLAVPVGNDVELRDLVGQRTVATIHAAAAVTWAELDRGASRVATADSDGAVEVWHLDGSRAALMRGHTAAAASASFSPDGRAVVSASLDGTVRVWDAATGADLAVLEHTDQVVMAAFDETGRRVITTSGDPLVRLWDVDRRTIVGTYQHDAPILAAAISHDGALLAGAGQDGTVAVWDVASGDLVTVLRTGDSLCSNVEFLSDGATLLATGREGHTVLWNVRTELPTPATVTAFVDCHSPEVLANNRLQHRDQLPRCAPSPGNPR